MQQSEAKDILKKDKMRPLRKCASTRVPERVALKDCAPFANTFLLPPPQLVGSVRKGNNE